MKSISIQAFETHPVVGRVLGLLRLAGPDTALRTGTQQIPYRKARSAVPRVAPIRPAPLRTAGAGARLRPALNWAIDPVSGRPKPRWVLSAAGPTSSQLLSAS